MEIKVEIIKIINEIKAIFKKEVKKVRKKLPQIYRFIPAQHLTLILKTIFWVILFGFLVYNFLPLPYFQSFVINNKPEEHIRLGEEYLENNDYENAVREYNLALNSKFEIRNSKQILNIKNSNSIKNKITYINNLISKKNNLENETTRWEEILRERPNYRDAYLELSMLHFQLKRPLTAKEYLERAVELDPNFPLTKELGEILQKK